METAEVRGSRAGRGRKPVPSEERMVTLHIGVSPAERERLVTVADQRGVSLSAVVREALGQTLGRE